MSAAPVPSTRDAFLSGAEVIGRRLCRDAIWAGSRCTWIGSSTEFVDNAWTVGQKPAGADLYSGTSGIALFLAELYAVTGEGPLRKAALGGMAAALSSITDVRPFSGLGFYTGLTGIAYVLLQTGQRLQEPALVERGFGLLDSFTDAKLEDAMLDVIGGCAGAIPVLLRTHAEFHRPSDLALAVRCGHHLLARSQKTGAVLSWDTLGKAGTRNLTGFSHGTAGIGWALSELSQATGDSTFRDAADQAFSYERALFSFEHSNWPDLRDMAGQVGEGLTYAVAWCHGAPGIGLSRLRAFSIFGNQTYRSEAATATKTTMQNLEYGLSTGMNFCLCHGMCGNAELLLKAEGILPESSCRVLAERVGSQVLAHLETGAPIPCGVPNGGETSGLLLGIAGVGYYLLRLARPQLESVLIVGPS